MAAKTKASKSEAARKQHAQRTRIFRDFIAQRTSGFADLPEPEQNALAGWLYSAHVGCFSHNSDEPDAFPLHWRAKQSKFGTAQRFHELNARFEWFEQVLGAKVGKSAAGWRLTDKARRLLGEYHDMGKQQHLPFYDLPDSDRAMVTADNRTARKPQSPIASRTLANAKTSFKPWSLPLNVTIDGDNLHQFLHAASARYHGEPCPAGFEWAWSAWDEIERIKGTERLHRRLSETIAQAAEFLRTAWVSKLNGFVVHQSYTETSSGRALANGTLNLQSCHREVRKACLPGHFDYDVECCHFALLASLAQRNGFQTPRIDAYTTNKLELRRRVRMVANASLSDAKAVITSLIYGAQLSASPKGSLAALVGKDAAERLTRLDPLRALADEIRDARSVVLESHRAEVERFGNLTNAAGRRIKARGVKGTSLLSHILQGEESQVLKACIAFASEHIVLLAHDGFVTVEEIDAAALEQRIRMSTGHRLKLCSTPFPPPSKRNL